MTVGITETPSAVPILDYALVSSPATRDAFLEQLRHALISIGFFYLANPPVPEPLLSAVSNYARDFFDLPQEASTPSVPLCRRG